MSKISDILAKNNAKTPRSAKVKVSLDAEVSAQREQLEADLEKAKTRKADQRAGQANPVAAVQQQLDELLERAKGQILTVKVTKLSGLEWVELSDHYPARPGVALDNRTDYDVTATCLAAARRNVVLVDDDGTELPFVHTAPRPATDTDPGAPGIDEFGDLLAALSGWDVSNIVTAVFTLNVMQSATRLTVLGKESQAANA
jgi:hypothetical protein